VTVPETAGVWKGWRIRDVREGDVTNSTLPCVFLNAQELQCKIGVAIATPIYRSSNPSPFVTLWVTKGEGFASAAQQVQLRAVEAVT
jgi:hypothetical protein